MVECDYSFEMLYHAAFGQVLSKSIKLELQQMSQEKINTTVRSWAKKAAWMTEEKMGVDGKIYVAFYPKSKS